MRKVYTGYCGTREIEHGLCVGNSLTKERGLSLRTGAQTMLYHSLSCMKAYGYQSENYSVTIVT